MAALIYSQKIQKSFGAKRLFHGITFGIAENDRVGIIGPNGSGKSTFITILSGLIKPTAGRIYIKTHSDQIDLFSQYDLTDRTQYRRDHIGIIFQEPNLFDYLTVEQNIQVPLLIQNKKVEDFQVQIDEYLKTCQIEHRRQYNCRLGCQCRIRWFLDPTGWLR